MVAQLESGGRVRSQAKPAVAQIVFVVVFLSFFFVSEEVGSGVEAGFHR